MTATQGGRLLILGVAASDSHAVANILIARYLRGLGFEVVNLGPCTPVAEFARACRDHPAAEAVLIGSLNGQIHADLADLPAARARGDIRCPVIVGGNLSVGGDPDAAVLERLRALGVDRILAEPTELPAALDRLRQQRTPRKPLAVGA